MHASLNPLVAPDLVSFKLTDILLFEEELDGGLLKDDDVSQVRDVAVTRRSAVGMLMVDAVRRTTFGNCEPRSRLRHDVQRHYTSCSSHFPHLSSSSLQMF
jgi:hypothetical protein